MSNIFAFYSAGMKDPSKLTGKDEIYNLVIDMFESQGVRFLDIEEGKHVATVSSNFITW